jgi:saccharopine dehydrogenase-like NADP-dependent oxidoreductase
MRILVIGGGGEMGRHAVRTLCEAEEVDQVVVGDRDRSGAAAVVAEVGTKATARELDVTDGAALRRALNDVEVVLCTAGPFYLLGLPVLAAAIETGTHYLDICDDWEPTLEMLELDDRAREAGVTAVIGMGASPGISNLLAVLAMNECDRVDRVFTAWRAGAGLPRPTPENPRPRATAAVEHWVHNCSDPIRIWRDGQAVQSWALEELPLTYPGLGSNTVWICGHPEPLTLPRARPEVRESLNVMTSRPGLMAAMRRVAARVRSGELDIPAASELLLIEPNIAGSAAGEAPSFPGLFALAEGVKDGQAVRVAARPIAAPAKDMGEFTGIPLAVATLMMVRGEVDKPGVHGPEAAVDAETFFNRLATTLGASPADGRTVELVAEAA